MKKQRFISLMLTALFAISMTGVAQAQLKISESQTAKLYMTLHTVGILQDLNQKNVFDSKGVALARPSTGFQNAFGDMGFIGKLGKKGEVEVVFDMYLASRNHPSTTYGNEGYLLMHSVPENLESLKFLKPLLSRRRQSGAVSRRLR